MPLTVRQVERETEAGRYGDGYGLYLQITKSGARSWVFRYERDGKERMMGLGPLHTVSLEDARELARQARRKLLEGVDPLSARQGQKAAAALDAARQITFKGAVRQYYTLHERKWKNRKHAAQFLSTLQTYAVPVLGSLAVADITTGHVLRVLEPIWLEKTETASRVRSRIESVLSWATVRGYRTGDNPARWSGHLREALPARSQVKKVKHHTAMPFAEVPVFMASLRKREGIAARALELTVLTAARTGEVIGATWPEFDLEQAVWTIPAERMKAGKAHRVPLNDRALQILAILPREHAFVFPGMKKGTSISNMSMAAVLKRMDIGPEKATVHGFRSAFRDWAAERTAYSPDVIEMALAHAVKNKVEAAYRRSDLFEHRRSLMSEWTAYCAAASPAHELGQLEAKRHG